MSSFNKIIIVGHLGHNPDLHYTAQNVPVCTFNVATTEGKKGEPNEKTTWFRVTFWREKAELANKYLVKGKPVYIEGRLTLREWQDRDGATRTSLEVTGTELHFIDQRGEGTAAAATAKTTDSRSGNQPPSLPAGNPNIFGEEPAEDIDEGDIPF